jgi:hypothetical protein
MPNHRITGVVVASALVAGVTGGVLAATSATAEAPHHSAAAFRPAAVTATTVIDQARALGRVGHVATPVAKLVEDSLTGTASRDALAKDAAAARASIDATRQANTARTSDRAARDATSDALADLQNAVNKLVSSLTGTAGSLLGAATNVVNGLLGTIGAILGGALGDTPGLPAPSSAPVS